MVTLSSRGAPEAGGERGNVVPLFAERKFGEDQALLARVFSGDPAARDQLVRRFIPIVHRRLRLTISRWTGARSELEDLVQDALVAFLSNDYRILRAWDPARGRSLDSFVALVSHRKALDVLIGRARRPQELLDEAWDEADPRPSPENVVLSRAMLTRVLAEMESRTSPLGWTVFLLTISGGLDASVVAELTGCSSAAIYQQRARLRRLGAEIHRELSGEESHHE